MPYNSLSHTKWDHIYHVVFVPYRRKKVLYGKVRELLGAKIRELAIQRGSNIVEGHMVQDHVHMMIKIQLIHMEQLPYGWIQEIEGFMEVMEDFIG